MAPHSSTLAWKIPWTEEPGRLQSMGSLGVGHDWATSLSLFTFMHWRRKWQPTPVSCLEKPRDGGAWWAAISGVAQSRTRLKWLSSSSSSSLPSLCGLLPPCPCSHCSLFQGCPFFPRLDVICSSLTSSLTPPHPLPPPQPLPPPPTRPSHAVELRAHTARVIFPTLLG